MVRHLILVRHGESEWNQKNLFCGWFDADLSDLGRAEAKKAGALLKEANYDVKFLYTSVLCRAIHTMDGILEVLGWKDRPVKRLWRLNERHYGALQGLNKSETAARYGEDQVKVWRRSYDVPPPPVEETSEHYPGNSPLYKGVPKEQLPYRESLKDTVARVVPCWEEELVPALKQGNVLIAAHGNSIRAIVKIITECSDEKIAGTEIPTGIPLVYELDESTLKFVTWKHLGSDEDYDKSVNKNKAQGKAK